MKRLSELLDASSALHQHLCPRQVLGVRMGLWAGELLQLDLPQTDKRLLTIVETDGCFADGVAVATNCWVGRRTMRVEDYGKVAATFVDTLTGQTLRLTPQTQARDLAHDYAPEANHNWEAMLLGYQRMATTQLFCVESVELTTPIAQIVSHPGQRVACVHCGEEIINERELILDGRVFCRTCAGRSYYRLGNFHTTHPRYNGRQPLDLMPLLPITVATETSLASRRTRELIAAFEVSQEIVAQLDLEHLLRSVTDRARDLFQAQAAFLCLLQPDDETLELAASSGCADIELGMTQAVHHGLTQQVIDGGQTIQTTTPCASCAVLCHYGSGCCHATPLQVGGTRLGALCIICQPGKAFDRDRAQSLQLLANAAAIAISNARLATTARQEAVRAAAAAEREQLAAELHDHLAQTLGFLNLKTDRLQDLANDHGASESIAILGQMKTAITTAYTQVRVALTGLRQPSVTPANLMSKLATCLAEFRVATGINADLKVAGTEALALSPVTQTQVIQIVREALTNVQRHAQARQVCVRVEQRDGLARFVVEDDGCGFDPQASKGDHHLGIKIMQMRAERSSGQLAIHSAPGVGTKIIVEFPVGQ